MKYVFVVGCPRSGTTWLQMLLAQHPSVATTQETHLFSGYIAPLDNAWSEHEKTPRGVGVGATLSESEFNNFCAGLAHKVLDNVAKQNPEATVVLEKTPDHVQHAPLILKLLPDAHFIHIVRDPRAVAASLSAASRSWGSAWASSDQIANVKRWCSDISLGQHIADLTPHYQEVRYEDLAGDQAAEKLQPLFHGMGLEANRDFCAQVLAACQIDRLRDKSGDLRAHSVINQDPRNFYRKGQADGWKYDLTKHNVEAIEYIAQDKMREFDYSLTTSVSGDALHKPLRFALHEIVDGVEWRVRRALRISFGKIHQAI